MDAARYYEETLPTADPLTANQPTADLPTADPPTADPDYTPVRT